MTRMKAIQIGTGLHGLGWIKTMSALKEHVELTAIVDMNPDNLEKASQLLGDRSIPAYPDYKKALAETDADIAVIVTPPGTHKILMEDTLNAGLHVIMEKPISPDWNESVKMAAFAEMSEHYVMISQNYRWNPVILAVKEAIDANAVGRIENVEWTFARNHTAASSFVSWRKQLDEMFLKEMCVHHFDLMRYFLGSNAVSVYAESQNPTWSWLDSNGIVSAVVRFESNVMAHYYASFLNRGTNTPWNGNFRLLGSEGAIEVIDDKPSVVKPDGTKEPIPVREMKHTGLQHSMMHMIDSIRKGRKPSTHIGDNLYSWEIVCKAAESIREGRRIHF